jgi:chemotaxis signal transduction protein
VTDTALPLPAALREQRHRMEAVWRERAQRLSHRPNLARASQNEWPVVVLGIGKERYGIDLQDVAEVFPPIVPTPVPGAAAVFSGVINVHGEIRPVIHLRKLLGIETPAEMAGNNCSGRVILLRKDGREMGLEIDSVEQIRWIAPGELFSAPSESQPAHNLSPYVKGSTKDLLMLLNTKTLFAELDIA